MAEFNLKFIKISFLVVIAMLVLAMASGMDILRGGKFIDWNKWKMEANFLNYKRALAKQDSGSGSGSSAAVSEYAESVPVLLYHGVIKDPNWKKDDTNISLSNFKEQMFSLKKAGYQTITLSDFYEFMKNGKKLPEKSFLLTFDDGRKDSFYPVDPLLKALGYNAVMFAITGQSATPEAPENNFYLSLSELQSMAKNGRWEIESHGDFDHDWEKIDSDENQGHFLSNRLWLSSENREESEDEAKARIIGDLTNAKAKIKKYIGTNAIAYAFPFNDYGQEQKNFSGAQDFIKANASDIYQLDFYQVENDDPAGNYPDPSQKMIKRLDVNADMETKTLLGILERNQDKKIPFSDNFWNDQGWVSRWGEKKIWGDLEIRDEAGEKSGNLTVLLGTRSWNNYSFKSTFRIEQGNSLSQVVGYLDDDNYTMCNYSSSDVSIAEKKNGEEHVLASSQGAPNFFLFGDNQAESQIQGGQISCVLNGVKYAEAKSEEALQGGGIGFYVWDDVPGQSFVRVKKAEAALFSL
jgi:peptidoglycan/xylan/chitin deacetylase (PgdA/CDA1 family)